MQVHIDRGGQRFGPYSVEQVNSHLAEGTILPTDLGWTDGMTDWVPVTQVAGVTFADAAATAAVPPPTPAPTAAPMTGDTTLQGGVPAIQTAAKPAGNKKLLIGVGAGVGVLALAAVGYFAVYPMLTDDEGEAPADGVADNTPTPSGPGGPGGPGMGPPPGGGVAGGGQGGRPQGGFGGGKGGGQGGGFPGGFGGGKGGGQGRPQGGFGGQGGSQQGGGMNLIARFDQNKDGKLSKAEVPQQMAGLFDRMDQNKDGFVDQNEMRSMGGKGRPQGGGLQQPGGFGGKGRPQGGGQQQPGGFGGKGRPQGGVPVRPQPRTKQ